jgi:hypothetical protein
MRPYYKVKSLVKKTIKSCQQKFFPYGENNKRR